ncbi:MAG: aminotransferase class V-fold PLP-dependent enzyme [Gemmataceae bacterium]|nr:aminotransferase class V-fold PLP-dependent enzyme [Gemmataceae bacterium]
MNDRPQTGEGPTPAILGGTPIFPEGPPDWPGVMPEVAAAVAEAMADGSWGRYDGPHTQALESDLADWHGCRVLTCASGTLAVQLALQSVGVQPGDRVVLAAYDYEGNFLSVHALGAIPVLVDVAGDLSLDLNPLEEACRRRPKAMVVSHLHGSLQPMKTIRNLADRWGVAVVEDAAQAVGAIVQDRPVGTWGDVGVLSFGGSKLLTAGRGGALLTRRDELEARLRVLLRRGVQRWAALSELQAAALRPQLKLLPDRHAQRAAAVACIDPGLDAVPGVRRIRSEVDGSPAFYKVAFRIDPAEFGLDRDRLVEVMRAEGLALDTGFRALPAGRSPRRYEIIGGWAEAERFHHRLTVLHHPVLIRGEEAARRIAQAWQRVYANRDRLRPP